ncbi:MAG: acetylxylan esterase [Verrucomicrobiales bacterium]
MKAIVLVLFVLASMPCLVTGQTTEVPPELRPWVESQQSWQRDTEGPIVSLGVPDAFDDSHVFAPAVALEDGQFRLWYCGASGTVKQRVFELGLATSSDGRSFAKHPDGPVFGWNDGQRSVLTPTLLRHPDGATLREDGKLRMWFSSTSFTDASGLHTLHETSSSDGIHWAEPSPVLLKDVYAPTVIKTGRWYQMWFTDVGSTSWIMRHASSQDGSQWRVTPEPVLVLDQEWEKESLFYPTVIQREGVYCMWYGSYWAERSHTTALGFAVSLDGLKWYKHPGNPVFRPDPARPWESHYTTSQSVMRLPDGGLRMWYASRKAPPFSNKYFAIATAVLPEGLPEVGIEVSEEKRKTLETTARNRSAFRAWQSEQRARLRRMLGIPEARVPLEAEKRGQLEWDGLVIEKWIFTSESGSRIPAVLYRPKDPPEKMPVIVLTFGHGGSKSQWQYSHAAQVYAKLGLACLAMDPLGEEERHAKGRLGTRAHDPKAVSDRADRAGRLVMGKLIFDTMRGIDFLLERGDVDAERIGVAGNSLGGATAGWMAALEPRIKMALVSGWAFHDIGLRTKCCTKLPNQRMREFLTWTEYAALAAPDCATLVLNGDADWVIDREDDGSAWRGTDAVVEDASKVYETLGADAKIAAWFEPEGGHRPYMIYKEALEWVHHHLGTPALSLEEIRKLPTVNSGDWCDRHGIELESLYGTDLHQRGATLPDFTLRPIPREKLACLEPGEIGSDDFTVEGWLKQIEGAR